MVTNIDSDITQTIDKNKTKKKRQFGHKNEEETKKYTISENFPTQETKENVINARRGRMHKI